MRRGSAGANVADLQAKLNALGFSPKLVTDGLFGAKTDAAVRWYQRKKGLVIDGIAGPRTISAIASDLGTFGPDPVSSPTWMTEARKHKGKKETDAAFAAFMVSKWPIVGLALKTIATSWSAWCGLFIAVVFAASGIDWQRDGALARNWGKYGTEIAWKAEGIPEGAVVWVNHSANCKSSSSNHVAFADGDCAPKDLVKSGATINLLGGNQANMVKVSTYRASTICGVRWPKDAKRPRLPVVQSRNCTSGVAGQESTR